MSLLSAPEKQNGSHSQHPQRAAGDAELLNAFVRQQSEQAFAEIVSRYGEMVFAVALRSVRHRQTAEDVTQATFLVLAKDAKKIKRSEALGSWLHGVAIRLAKKALRRCRKEQVTEAVTELEIARESFEEIHSAFEQQVLDEELNGLPPQYRDPLVLHFLQGLTYEETAQQLGVTIGAIEGRIKRGKRELHLRLSKRGVGMIAALSAISWSQTAAAATVRPEFIQSITATGLSALQGTAFPAACSPEAVYLAGKEITMFTTAKMTLLTCGLMLAGGVGWLTHAGLADDGAGLGTDSFGTVVNENAAAGGLSQEGTTNGDELLLTQAGDPFGDAFGQGGDSGGFGGVGGTSGGASKSREQKDQDQLNEVIRLLSQLDGKFDPGGYNGPEAKEISAALKLLLDYQKANTSPKSAGRTKPPANLSEYGSGYDGGSYASGGMFGGTGTGASGGPKPNLPKPDLVRRNVSVQEQEIRDALGNISTFEFPGNPLTDVIEFIRVTYNIPILFDEVALNEEGISIDEETSLVLSGVPLSSALNLMLEKLDLTYVIKNDVMMITTRFEAEKTLETVIYDVRSMDIKSPEALADVIVYSTSGPWMSKDGDGGEISFLNGSVIIRQSGKVHEEIEKLLENLAAIEQSHEQSPQWPVKSRPTMGGGYGMGGEEAGGDYGMEMGMGMMGGYGGGTRIPIRGSWDHVKKPKSGKGDSGGGDDGYPGAGGGYAGGEEAAQPSNSKN